MATKMLKHQSVDCIFGVEPSYESIFQIGTPLYNGQKACSQCVRCSEAPLYIDVATSTKQGSNCELCHRH